MKLCTFDFDGTLYRGDGRINIEVAAAFLRAKADAETLAVLLTGRMNDACPGVQRVLTSFGLPGRRIVGFDFKPLRLAKAAGPFGLARAAEHGEIYNGDGDRDRIATAVAGGMDPTVAHKVTTIERLLADLPAVDSVECWDDREDQVPEIRALLRRLQSTGRVRFAVMHWVISNDGA